MATSQKPWSGGSTRGASPSQAPLRAIPKGIGAADGALCVAPLAAGDRAAFDALYALYERLFPLSDEREPPEAFLQILALNDDADVQRRFGPWREIVAAVRVGADGPVVGGHVFGVTTSGAHAAYGCGASVQGIYTFFDASVRGRTPILEIKRYFQDQALRAFGLTRVMRAPLVFLEVNNPLRMSAAEIAEDTARSGIDPHRRYVFWQRCGLRPLRLPYVQPRLRPDAQPVRCLDLFCSADGPDVPAAVVAQHLRAFVSVSVLKGADARTDADFAPLAAWLDVQTAVAFVNADADDQRMIHAAARAAAR